MCCKPMPLILTNWRLVIDKGKFLSIVETGRKSKRLEYEPDQEIYQPLLYSRYAYGLNFLILHFKNITEL